MQLPHFQVLQDQSAVQLASLQGGHAWAAHAALKHSTRTVGSCKQSDFSSLPGLPRLPTLPVRSSGSPILHCMIVLDTYNLANGCSSTGRLQQRLPQMPAAEGACAGLQHKLSGKLAEGAVQA